MESTEWEPTFEGWPECQVEMSESAVPTHCDSRNEYGVLVQHPICPYEGDGAIFWIDPQHLYFRYSWSLWFPIENDDPENCATLCKRRTASMLLCTASSIKHHPLKVYHIDRLPVELFGETSAEPPPEPVPAEVEIENGGDAEAAAGDTDPGIVTVNVLFRGGDLVAKSDSEQFPSAFYELHGHFLCVTYFRHSGDWLADEEPCPGDAWPMWFGESAMDVSPLAAARALRDKIRPLLPKDTPAHSIVLLNNGCSVINESEFAQSWRADDVAFVRPEEVEGSGLTSVARLLDSYVGIPNPELKSCAPAIGDLLDAFPLANPNPEAS